MLARGVFITFIVVISLVVVLTATYLYMDIKFRKIQRDVIIYKKTGKCPDGKSPVKNSKKEKKRVKIKCNRNLPNCRV